MTRFAKGIGLMDSMLKTCYLTVTNKWASNSLFASLTFPPVS